MESNLGDVQAFIFKVIRATDDWTNPDENNKPTSFETLAKIKEFLNELQNQ